MERTKKSHHQNFYNKTTMKTLYALQQPFFCTTKSKSFKDIKPPTILYYQTSQILNHKTIFKVQAEAKGFNTNRAPPNKKPETLKKNKQNNNDDDEKIPEVVFERIISRILTFVGVPLITGIVLLKIFDVVKEQHLFEFPFWLPTLTTFITFGASAIGIAYGTLSTSWDPDRKGSVLGLEEAQENWGVMWKEDEE